MEELFSIGPGSVRRFFARWYGPPDRDGRVPAGSDGLPAPLRAWYEAASGYSAPVTVHNTVLEPGDVCEKDGKLVFWWENQGVYEWAADPDGEDPLVYERPTDDGEPWYPTGVRLTAFLVSVAVCEAIQGAEHGLWAEFLTSAERDTLLAPLRPLPMPGPRSRAQLYAGDGLLASAYPDSGYGQDPASSMTWSVELAATDADLLRYAEPLCVEPLG